MSSTSGRSSLGFGDELDSLDNATWPIPDPASKRTGLTETKAAAAAAGFRSREPASQPEAPKLRRRRTGRNAQLNLKTTPETIAMFTALADANGWGLGEAFEKATDLLARDAPMKPDSR